MWEPASDVDTAGKVQDERSAAHATGGPCDDEHTRQPVAGSRRPHPVRLPDTLPRVRMTDFELSAVDTFHEGLLMAPATGIIRAKAGVEHTFGRFPTERMNPNGGSIAIGHPFGATGARILSQSVKELAAMPSGSRAIVSICADGGQGTVALLEN